MAKNEVISPLNYQHESYVLLLLLLLLIKRQAFI